MNIKRWWCSLFIIAFSVPVFAVDIQIDSFDNIAGTSWVDGRATGYMQQEQVAEVKEGTGSMKIDFTLYVSPNYDIEPIRTFSPALDFTDYTGTYKDLAITLWMWTGDPNDTRATTLSSRLKEIILYDSSNKVGRFTVPLLKNEGWNKVIAPLRNFVWKQSTSHVAPDQILWDEITQIGLYASCKQTARYPLPDYIDPNAIYFDDLRLEDAPSQPARPYQLASFDDIVDELWDGQTGYELVLQAPDANSPKEGTGSMLILYEGRETYHPIDLVPKLPLIPALDFTDYSDWAISVWVWTSFDPSESATNYDESLTEIIVHDSAGNRGIIRVPLPWTYGWHKVTARLDELFWQDQYGQYIEADEAWWEAIIDIELHTTVYKYPGSGANIFLDDLQLEAAVEALSDAAVYNADRVVDYEISIDGNAADWAGLVDSDIIDFDNAATKYWKPGGNLHVKYRLAWDPNYLYILVEEQSGDGIANEAPSLHSFYTNSSSKYDHLALQFDFTNNRQPGIIEYIGFWAFLGLSSTEQTDLLMAWTNRVWGAHKPTAVANGSVATSGTLGSRVIEAKVKWSDLDDTVDSWLQPAGGIEAAVKPGFIFGCDPKLPDLDGWSKQNRDAEHGGGWLSGWLYQDETPGDRLPTGRDIYSVDMRLVCSAGDLDFDCDVDYVDYAQFASEWLNSGCNNLNDFCNGADIVINGDVGFEDLVKFAEIWLLP
jgi:hypothetical protein